MAAAVDPQGLLYSSTFQRAVRATIARHPNADASVLRHLSGDRLAGEDLFDFVAVHATSGPHARALLGLAPGWAGTLADLVAASDVVAAPARA